MMRKETQRLAEQYWHAGDTPDGKTVRLRERIRLRTDSFLFRLCFLKYGLSLRDRNGIWILFRIRILQRLRERLQLQQPLR